MDPPCGQPLSKQGVPKAARGDAQIALDYATQWSCTDGSRAVCDGENMPGKMNWDRVRKENLVLRRGSEWVESGKGTDPPRQPKGQMADPKILGPSMPGCSCGKPKGFLGIHKKRCSLMYADPPNGRMVQPASRIAKAASPTAILSHSQDLTISDLAKGLRKAGVSGLWKEFLRLQLRMLGGEKALNQNARREVNTCIEVFLRELSETGPD
jgi:hypothetical protein